ncbi:putative membrane protein yetF [Streptococcus pneumoniae]|nr:putative membrane protein yetF [Streptococcus pneumoniae]
MKQVKRAVQEQNGQLIVVQMGDENPKYPVVTDGVIQVDVLESIGRSEEWLLDNLSKQGHDNVANIFIAEYDKGAVTVVTYEKEKPGVLYSRKSQNFHNGLILFENQIQTASTSPCRM